MMTDMEGVSGIRSFEEPQPEIPAKYEPARAFLCGDVNAAIAGAFDGGATEVIVRDGHASGFNFHLEMMDPRAKYVGRGADTWTPGLDDTVDAAFFVGAHAMAGTPNAFAEHTQSPESWYAYSVNGREFGEQGQFGMICGERGIPVVLVTGDEAACREGRDFFPGCETVTVKWATGRNSCIVIHPERAHEMIRAGAKRAVERAAEVEPLRVSFPAEIRLSYFRTDHADGAARHRDAVRVDSRTVKWTANDASEWILW